MRLRLCNFIMRFVSLRKKLLEAKEIEEVVRVNSNTSKYTIITTAYIFQKFHCFQPVLL